MISTNVDETDSIKLNVKTPIVTTTDTEGISGNFNGELKIFKNNGLKRINCYLKSHLAC